MNFPNGRKFSNGIFRSCSCWGMIRRSTELYSYTAMFAEAYQKHMRDIVKQEEKYAYSNR